ncbi:hypothetical protein FQN50_001746 [Emmonsiellopsis sp. PD_5]|nr:hypothetical protein FQN50_001746 [Emmonsiellopsis sp. PD_5]
MPTSPSPTPLARNLPTTPLFQTTQSHFTRLLSPSLGKITQASNPILSPQSHHLAFTGQTWRKLHGRPESRIFILDLDIEDTVTASREVDGGDGSSQLPLRIVSAEAEAEAETGDNEPAEAYQDLDPAFSPDGKYLSFRSNRGAAGGYQLYAMTGPRFDELVAFQREEGGAGSGSVEYAKWSADGRMLLVGVGVAEDVFGSSSGGEVPGWAPVVESAVPGGIVWWLRVYEVSEEGRMRGVGMGRRNVWEAVWWRGDRVVVILSDEGGESGWYFSRVCIMGLDLDLEGERVLYTPPSPCQVGGLVSFYTGAYVAFIQGRSSSRGGVVGDVIVVEVESGKVEQIQLGGVDVMSLEFVEEGRLFYTGLKGLQTVVGFVDVLPTDEVTKPWITDAASYGATPLVNGGFTIITGSWTQYPRISRIDFPNRNETTLHSFIDDGKTWLNSTLGEGSAISWKSTDGTEIQGLLRLPKQGKAPYPLIMHVHGGPVSSFKNNWPDIDIAAFLTANGYAVFCPNPRGSTGRGQDFVKQVYSDMGGMDCQDLLSGIDRLVETGIADQSRLGVTGGSYGGFMTNWIVTKTDRFAAAVAVSPISDWVSLHGTSDIPSCDRIMIGADPYDIGGEYQKRSPLVFAGKYRTPVLQIAGRNDTCTPPTQALQYHRALVDKGVESVCAIYPGEGHRVRKFPAYIDYCARLLGWFERYMPASEQGNDSS